MSNVPHGGARKRHTGIKSRSTHSPDNYQPAPGAPAAAALAEESSRQQVTTQDISPGSIGSGAFQEGALDLSSFAATLRPVHIVAALPALPDTDYPIGSVAVLTTDGKLYRNDADAWTTVVDADDIVATSIVAGAVTAGAISVEDIIIHDGHLTFSDQFGETVLDGAGFSQVWRRFVASMFLNGDFAAGSSSNIALSEVSGGDSDADYSASLSTGLPYWVVSETDPDCTLSVVTDATAESGQALRVTSATSGGGTTFYQDIPVVPGNRYLLRWVERADWTSNIGVTITVTQRDATHGLINSTILDVRTFTSDSLTYGNYEAVVPFIEANTRYLRVSVRTFLAGVGTIWYSGFFLERLSGYGTSFPLNPGVGETFYNTSSGMEFFYDSDSLWKSTQVYQMTYPVAIAAIAATTTGIHRLPLPARHGSIIGSQDMWLEGWQVMFFVNGGGTALSASHKWVGTMRMFDSAGAETAIGGSISIDSGSSSTWRFSRSLTDGTFDNDNQVGVQFTWTKTGTPGSLIVSATTIQFRYINS